MGGKRLKTGRNKEYEERIANAIGKKEFAKLSRGYDLLGDIAIIEFKGSRNNGREIANMLMEFNPNIKTVLKKVGAVSGKYRIRKVRYVAGRKNFIATYRENGCTFNFDMRKVYFSNRLSFERSRLLGLVKDSESVMVMFAGAGPFAIEIAKHVPTANVVAIELNRNGYNHILENIKINKTSNVRAMLGDVGKKAKEYMNSIDRIIMPLPRSSLDFLDATYDVAKKKAIVHLYAFSDSKEPFLPVLKRVKEHAKKRGYKIKLMSKRIVRSYSTSESEIVLDYMITK